MLSAISFRPDGLFLLDQRRLPHTSEWVHCRTLDEAAHAIEEMVVRGAPAIGCTAAFALALDIRQATAPIWGSYEASFIEASRRLAATRPTAVNLFYALERMRAVASEFPADLPLAQARTRLEAEAERLFAEDLATCQAIGRNGLSMAPKQAEAGGGLRVLTHCNTGSLATAGYGTALGVIRALHAAGCLERVYVDETRPWLQGARLTTYELAHEKIPHTLIVEGAAASLMQSGAIDWVIVGADRIAANGDTANKIGTYALAVLARQHGLRFYVAAPWASIDSQIRTGADITIEMRASSEVTRVGGTEVAPIGTEVFNPAFDVTPERLIDGIITERGVLEAPFPEAIAAGETLLLTGKALLGRSAELGRPGSAAGSQKVLING